MRIVIILIFVIVCGGCNSLTYGHLQPWKLNQIQKFSVVKMEGGKYPGIRIDIKNMSQSVVLSALPSERGELTMVCFLNGDGNFVLIEEDLGHAGIWGFVRSDVDILELSKRMSPMVGHSSYSPFVDVTEKIGGGWYKCNFNLD